MLRKMKLAIRCYFAAMSDRRHRLRRISHFSDLDDRQLMDIGIDPASLDRPKHLRPPGTPHDLVEEWFKYR